MDRRPAIRGHAPWATAQLGHSPAPVLRAPAGPQLLILTAQGTVSLWTVMQRRGRALCLATGLGTAGIPISCPPGHIRVGRAVVGSPSPRRVGNPLQAQGKNILWGPAPFEVRCVMIHDSQTRKRGTQRPKPQDSELAVASQATPFTFP